MNGVKLIEDLFHPSIYNDFFNIFCSLLNLLNLILLRRSKQFSFGSDLFVDETHKI